MLLIATAILVLQVLLCLWAAFAARRRVCASVRGHSVRVARATFVVAGAGLLVWFIAFDYLTGYVQVCAQLVALAAILPSVTLFLFSGVYDLYVSERRLKDPPLAEAIYRASVRSFYAFMMVFTVIFLCVGPFFDLHTVDPILVDAIMGCMSLVMVGSYGIAASASLASFGTDFASSRRLRYVSI